MLKEFQEENADKIDDRFKEVTDAFGVNPRELIGRVLEYRIDWEDVRIQ